MEEKAAKYPICYNVKLPDSQCYQCIWLEWNQNRMKCLNRNRMVCNLHVEDVFGSLVTKTVN